MSEEICLVVGLGNPGTSYENTRHNIGFMVLDRLARHWGVSISAKRCNTLWAKARVNDRIVHLAKPMSYMNRSGIPVYGLSGDLGVEVSNIMVIHDDMDLDFGRLKIKEKGGHGGHKGVKSMIDAFGGGDFVRLRMGIGRPDDKPDVTDYVLGKFSRSESDALGSVIEEAISAVETILGKGAKEGMNMFNRKTSNLRMEGKARNGIRNE